MTSPTASGTSSLTPTGGARWGWRILVTVSALLVLNGVGLYLFLDTHVERTIGLLVAAVGAFALVATVEGARPGVALARRVAWVLAATLAAIGLHSLRSDRLDLVGLYLALAAIAVVGAVLTQQGTEVSR